MSGRLQFPSNMRGPLVRAPVGAPVQAPTYPRPIAKTGCRCGK